MEEIYQFVDIEYTLEREVPPERELTVLVQMGGYQAHGMIHNDRLTGSISLAIPASNPEEAIGLLAEPLRSIRAVLGALSITSIDVMDENTRRARVTELVGYSAIAEMANVSRQRARDYTHVSGFPRPLTRTQDGLVYSRADVQQWLDSRKHEPYGFRIIK
ncbi:MAG TPA: hypothetical protein VF281_03360 [Candidatus Saccharimonadales bacterium]